MVRIRRSHRRGLGSIPGVGIFLLFLKILFQSSSWHFEWVYFIVFKLDLHLTKQMCFRYYNSKQAKRTEKTKHRLISWGQLEDCACFPQFKCSLLSSLVFNRLHVPHYCMSCLHCTAEHTQRLKHGRVGQPGPRCVLIEKKG